MKDNIAYYRSFSEITDPVHSEYLLQSLPDDIGEICQIVQGLLIHAYWLERYDCLVTDERKYSDMQTRHITEILDCIYTKSDQPINSCRVPEKRVVSICRDFALMLCAILRSKGIAARIRCGFSRYLVANHFEDHWICEYWHPEKGRWIMVDAQLDDVHREALQFDFDPCDVPSTEFISAGKAWQLCRSGDDNPQNFGIHNITGLAFIKGNIIRDIFALNKIELLAWDTGWGILKNYIEPIKDDVEFSFLDQLAVCSANSDIDQARGVLKEHNEISLPADWDWAKSTTISDLLKARG